VPGKFGGVVSVGDVVSADFPEHSPRGHEQEGSRPAVMVGVPEALGTSRFPTLLLAPLTSDRGEGRRWAEKSPALYPRLQKGTAGLRSDSICLLDQVRALDVERVGAYLGSLSGEEYRPIREGLVRMMEFSEDVAEELQPREEGEKGGE
jgi:mRNA interferase MazF